MSDSSSIEWTATVHPDGTVTPGATWNPVRGCDKISAGCKNCYASTFAERWRGVKGHPYEQGFDLRLVPEKLDEPLRWRKPRRIFVNSMSDLFHKDVPSWFIERAVRIMEACPQHTFQILTKRADRMREFFGNWTYLRNVWLGVSVEDQKAADERIPHLLSTPAAVRFLSCEPLLERADLERAGAWVWRCECCGEARALEHPSSVRWRWAGDRWQHLCESSSPQVGAFDARCFSSIDWVIVGGESGPGARPCDVAWVRDIVQQCKGASVPCFVKQLGARVAGGSIGPTLSHPKGGDPTEWPDDLRVREFPEVRR